MLRTILIDDEALALKSLKHDLETYCSNEVKIVDICQTPLQALASLRQHHPDLVFLDVGMKGHETDGFGILEIWGEIDFELIFVTADEAHALRALKLQATDYLLKPFHPEELKEAVHKVLKKQALAEKSEHSVSADTLIKTDHLLPDQLPIYTSEGILFMNLHKVMYCLADGSYTRIFLADEKPVLASKLLRDLEEMLPLAWFFRIHNSHLVSRHFIKKYKRAGNGYVIMKDDCKLEISRGKKQLFQQWLGLDT